MAKDFNFQSVYVYAIEDSSATLNLDWGELSASDIIVFACDNTGNVTQYYNWEVSKNDADRTYNLKIFNSDADFTAYVYRRESVSMQWSETANANLSIDAVKKQIEQIVRCVKQIEVQNKSGINAVDSVEGRLPDETKRANKFLTFDANGNPVADTPVDTLESNRKGAEDAEANAKSYAKDADDSKTLAQKWAIGADDDEDETYNNNAKYYAKRASEIVDGFEGTVELAVTSATEEIDEKVDKECVKLESYAEQAEDSKTLAQKWAIGADGTTTSPSTTNNAKYYANQAINSKTLAQKWAIGTNSTTETPSTTNNAKYYAQQAKTSKEQANNTLTSISKKVDGFDQTVDSAVKSAKSEIGVYTSASKDAIDKAFDDAEKDFNSLVSTATTTFTNNATTATTTFNNNARTKHSGIYTLYSNAKRNLDGCVDEAEYVLKNAVEIADPEGWRRNTRSMINVLQQTKSNKGEFYFNGGNAKIQNMAMNGSWSLCCRVKMQTAQVKYASIFQLGSFYLYWNTRLGVLCSPVISSIKQISIDDNNRLANGEWHTLVVSYDGTTLNLTDETGVLLSVATSEQISILGNLLIGAVNYNGQIADVKYFNFDMSDANAPYTIADYISGKDESPLLNNGRAMVLDNTHPSWEIYNSSSFDLSKDSTADTLTATCIASNNYLAISEGYTSIAKAGDVISISWHSIEIPTGISVNSVQFKANGITVATSNNESHIIPKDSAYIIVQFNFSNNVSVGDVITITGLKIRVNGALLSLADYTFNGEVLDESGNGNHATITGNVVGSKDKAVEVMYQKFASRVQNTTTE